MNKKIKKNDEVKKTDGKKVKINNSVKGSVYERWENEKSDKFSKNFFGARKVRRKYQLGIASLQ